MSCYHCEHNDAIREKARVAALEQQNTDLIKIVGELIRARLEFRFIKQPMQEQLRLQDYDAYLAKSASTQACAKIESMLEDRKQFFRDYYLLKMTATPEYYREINKDLMR